jgi:Uma2 family endonuclease
MAHQHLSVADYLAAERTEGAARHEYFNGTLRPCGSASPDHDRITQQIIQMLSAELGATAYVIASSAGLVQIGPTCIVRPDVAVSLAAEAHAEVDLVQAPLLAIEVFTPETVAFDLGQKAHAYRACPTIAEYVLVDCERAFVHVQRRSPEGTHWEMRDYRGAELLELRSLGVALALADIYEF